MDESRDDKVEKVGETTYRGITITRHPPTLFLNRDGRIALATCSFSVRGVAMVAASMRHARELIDKALGPP